MPSIVTYMEMWFCLQEVYEALNRPRWSLGSGKLRMTLPTLAGHLYGEAFLTYIWQSRHNLQQELERPLLPKKSRNLGMQCKNGNRTVTCYL